MVHELQYYFLHRTFKLNAEAASGSSGRLELRELLGDKFKGAVFSKIVIDFGCGNGEDVEQVGQWGAKLALGIEIREELVKKNLLRVTDKNCNFVTTLPSEIKNCADIVYSVDAFEHFDRPEVILQQMKECLRPGGEAYICFGPPWYHPRGGHLFSVFPWAHLLLSEKALLHWRNQYFNDGATKFNEVSGGLNQMSISRFKKIVDDSGFITEELRCIPIRGMKLLHFLFGKEFTTAFITARLRKPCT